jgi:N-acetyl sugar amidotransferase
MKIKKMIYCSKCTYPMVAVNLAINNDHVCSACKTSSIFNELDSKFWENRKIQFENLLENILKNNKSDYDCIIPVSGGKDSYYQTHLMVKEYGLKPLLVTYHGNNYLPEGDYNRDRMKDVFNADHLVMGPSVEVLKKINRLGFKKMGDMNWHNHCGIHTFPIQIAVKYEVPLMVWGEIAWDISGMFDPDDYVEFNARVRHEHSLRGFEWFDMLNDPFDPLKENDLLWAKYPSDEEILRVGIKGVYIGNFFKWDPIRHTKLVQEKYGWKEAESPFQRTYRRFSNLDDRYENGVHDLLKFIKFGYGRASDHSSKDIRLGDMTRDEAIDMVKKYDHIISDDLYHWLNYVDMTEEDFWKIADKFRDPRVWWIDEGLWWKDNIWGKPSSYGKVYLPIEDQKKFKN